MFGSVSASMKGYVMTKPCVLMVIADGVRAGDVLGRGSLGFGSTQCSRLWVDGRLGGAYPTRAHAGRVACDASTALRSGVAVCRVDTCGYLIVLDVYLHGGRVASVPAAGGDDSIYNPVPAPVQVPAAVVHDDYIERREHVSVWAWLVAYPVAVVLGMALLKWLGW